MGKDRKATKYALRQRENEEAKKVKRRRKKEVEVEEGVLLDSWFPVA